MNLYCLKKKYILLFFLSTSHSFTPCRNHQSIISPHSYDSPLINSPYGKSQSSTSLSMVFDFFKKRAQEGVDQLSNLSKKASEGKLTEALNDVSAYTSTTNQAFATGLAKSRNSFIYNLEGLLNNESGGKDFFDNLQDILLQADIGLVTSDDVIQELKSLRADSTQIITQKDIKSILRGKLIEVLQNPTPTMSSSATSTMQRTDSTYNPSAISFSDDDKTPTILFIMGANGMGKTTTIGKLASRLKEQCDQKVLLAACDTFRAGAVEQLEMWADRAGVSCFSPNENQKTPSAVLYGALDLALKDSYDVLIVDTSGRLSNNEALTEELVKMKRVIQKRLSLEKDEESGKPLPNKSVPHETLLVIDAAQGRMALESAKVWHKELGLTGLVLTKLDGSAKGGSVVAVSRELGLPVKLIGVGEKIEDLRDFEAEKFVDGLLGIGSAGGNKGAKNEGKELAARLSEMRKKRDERAKKQAIGTNTNASSPAPMVSSKGSTIAEIDVSEMNMLTNTEKRPAIFNKPTGGRKKKSKAKGKR